MSAFPHHSETVALTPAQLWAVPAIAGLLLAAVLASGDNQALFIAVNAGGAAAPDWLWADLTLLGNGVPALALTLIAVRRRPRAAVAVVYTALLTGLASGALKNLVDTARPPAVLAAGAFHLIGPGYGSHSFPSGHTATAFAVAGVISLIFNRAWLTALLCTAAAGVGLSRIMVGVHWPVDVCGGAALGWLCAAAGVALARRWRPRPRREALFALPLYLAAAALWWPRLSPYRDALPLQYGLAVVSLAAGAAAAPRLLRHGTAGRGD